MPILIFFSFWTVFIWLFFILRNSQLTFAVCRKRESLIIKKIMIMNKIMVIIIQGGPHLD